MIDFILLEKAVVVTEQQISKKLNNMKNRVKVKADHNKTGNKTIVLNAGEMLLLEMMGAEDNPSMSKISYGVSAGAASGTPMNQPEADDKSCDAAGPANTHIPEIEFVSPDEANGSHHKMYYPSSDFTIMDVAPKRGALAGKAKQGNKTEEDPTKMDTHTLQRHVLLQQLDIFKEQKRLFADFRAVLQDVSNFITSPD